MQRIVLAFSGSVATCAAIPWLADTYGAEIITVTIDLGQGRELEEVRDRALATGALRAHVLDERDQFAREYLMRGLRADTTGTSSAAMAQALSLPLIADKLVQIAGIESAASVAHAATSDAIDTAARTLNAGIRVVAPAREWGMDAAGVMDYARTRNVPLPPDGEPPFAIGDPAEPAIVDVIFDRGLPTGINGVGMSTLDLFESLGTIASAHNVGRARCRDLREAPASIVLLAAHSALLRAVSSEPQRRAAAEAGRAFIGIVEAGRWFTGDRDAIDAAVSAANERVTGTVRLKLFKGACEIVETHATPVTPASVLTVVK